MAAHSVVVPLAFAGTTDAPATLTLTLSLRRERGRSNALSSTTQRPEGHSNALQPPMRVHVAVNGPVPVRRRSLASSGVSGS
jgi:hypothetical protein